MYIKGKYFTLEWSDWTVPASGDKLIATCKRTMSYVVGFLAGEISNDYLIKTDITDENSKKYLGSSVYNGDGFVGIVSRLVTVDGISYICVTKITTIFDTLKLLDDDSNPFIFSLCKLIIQMNIIV